MDHACRHSDCMEELTRKAWNELGKPYKLTEPQVNKIFQHAMGEGKQQEVLDLHNMMPWDQKLDSVGEMWYSNRPMKPPCLLRACRLPRVMMTTSFPLLVAFPFRDKLGVLVM